MSSLKALKALKNRLSKNENITSNSNSDTAKKVLELRKKKSQIVKSIQNSDDDEEDEDDYKKGGYHPVNIGDCFNNNRYRVVRKLGWGHFSTVWLAKDKKFNRPTALKIVKSAAHYTETAIDEIKLLEKVATASKNHPHREFVVELYDSFKHSGVNGTHIAMSFEVLGPNLLTMIRRYDHRGIPVRIVKRIVKQVLMGLDYLHVHCGIIHTDLKPENILIQIDVKETMVRLGLDDLFIESKSSQDLTSTIDQSPVTSPLTPNQKKKLKAKARKEAQALKALEDVENSQSKKPTEISQPNTTINDDMDVESVSSEVFENENDTTEIKLRAELPPTPPSYNNQRLARALEDTGSLANSSEALSESMSTSHSRSGSKLGSSGVENLEDILFEDSTDKLHLSSLNLSQQSTASITPSDTKQDQEKSDEVVRVKIADLGNSCWVDKHFTMDIQTRQYRSPEVIIGSKYETSTDMWSLGCIVFELLTGEFLFDPKSGSKYSKDDGTLITYFNLKDHIAQMIELMGHFPKQMTTTGKYCTELFNRKGEVRHIHKLRFWTLPDVLTEKYRFHIQEAKDISTFILPMIQISPPKRASAKEMLEHDWIRDVAIGVDTAMELN
ncbi:serine/threonine protein kinase, CMGC group [Globomyces sp. JEL0801]|nr:serine/threonine protein kinase, CMGC group [Globomyces sp. JEL0801]